MKIDTVSVRYSELHSSGYPSFSNRTCGIELSARLDSGETAALVRDKLFESAKLAVAKMFNEAKTPEFVSGDAPEMTIPF